VDSVKKNPEAASIVPEATLASSVDLTSTEALLANLLKLDSRLPRERGSERRERRATRTERFTSPPVYTPLAVSLLETTHPVTVRLSAVGTATMILGLPNLLTGDPGTLHPEELPRRNRPNWPVSHLTRNSTSLRGCPGT